MAVVSGGRSLTPPHESKKKKKTNTLEAIWIKTSDFAVRAPDTADHAFNVSYRK
jgi:hypothetical protein